MDPEDIRRGRDEIDRQFHEDLAKIDRRFHEDLARIDRRFHLSILVVIGVIVTGIALVTAAVLLLSH